MLNRYTLEFLRNRIITNKLNLKVVEFDHFKEGDSVTN